MSNNIIIVVFGVYLFGLLDLTKAACRLDSIRLEITDFNTTVKYCEYEGLQLLPGSIVRNKRACEDALCSDTELSICGFGINAGVISVPNWLMVVADGCYPRVVPNITYLGKEPLEPRPILKGVLVQDSNLTFSNP